MTLLRTALAPLALFALAAPLAQDELAFGVAADTTLVRTLESKYTMELDSMSLAMNGEVVTEEFLPEFEIHVEHTERCVVTDAFEAVEGGGPLRVLRTFDELGAEEKSRFSGEGGDEDDDAEYESALEGKTVLFTWDAESEAFEAAFADGSEGDGELLAGLAEDMDLRRLLPERPVAEGDSWEIEGRVFECVLDPGGELGLEETESEEADTTGTDEALRANLTGTVTATYQGTQEEEGVRLAVIALEVDTSTHADRELGPEELEEGGSGTGRIESGFQLAGELRWDLAHGHAISLELSGTSQLTTKQTLREEFEGETMEQEQTMVFAGEMTITMRFERK